MAWRKTGDRPCVAVSMDAKKKPTSQRFGLSHFERRAVCAGQAATARAGCRFNQHPLIEVSTNTTGLASFWSRIKNIVKGNSHKGKSQDIKEHPAKNGSHQPSEKENQKAPASARSQHANDLPCPRFGALAQAQWAENWSHRRKPLTFP